MSHVQHDDEDLHEDIFNNEASGMEEVEVEDFPTATTTTTTATATDLLHNSAMGKSSLFENQSTIRPVIRQQSTEASSAQKHDHQLHDDEHEEQQQQMSTILIASIVVSCFVITALSVALVVYIAFRYRRRRTRI
ncbi:tRNA (uracil-O(2)-)-methyltransferase [Trichinella spiralis]|uniref:tRNA (Uracil-O(2)-)-methyltransferase n=1 Tax=Trichinella spiralis TaxID=6334 RepID=A0ABR3KZ95_TRISP